MRIALISDLHGNEIALTAVLDDSARRGVDRVVCLGDVATLGVRPGWILSRLRDLGCPCIMGNHDEFLLDAEMVRRYTDVPIIVDGIDWCRAELSADELAFVGTFQREARIPLPGGSTLQLYHGSPRSHMEDILATTPPDEVDTMLDGRTATAMAGGHTHIQMLRQHKGILMINPGSTGMPFKEYVAGRTPVVLDHGEYAIVHADDDGSISVELRRVPLSRAALRSAAAASSNPFAAMLVKQYS